MNLNIKFLLKSKKFHFYITFPKLRRPARNLDESNRLAPRTRVTNCMHTVGCCDRSMSYVRVVIGLHKCLGRCILFLKYIFIYILEVDIGQWTLLDASHTFVERVHLILNRLSGHVWIMIKIVLEIRDSVTSLSHT